MALPARHRPTWTTPTQAYPKPVNVYSRGWIPAPKISGMTMSAPPSGSLSYRQLVQANSQIQLASRGSLRQELYGRDPARFMDEHGHELRKIIQEDSPHQSVLIRSGWQARTCTFKVAAICRQCERVFSAELPQEALMDKNWERELVHALAQLVEAACRDQCFGVREGQLLAEWATNRLAEAGERGMPYVQLVHEAIAARLVTPAEVDSVLRKMKFVSEWVTLANSGIILPGGWDGEWTLPVLHLPQGHPLRTW